MFIPTQSVSDKSWSWSVSRVRYSAPTVVILLAVLVIVVVIVVVLVLRPTGVRPLEAVEEEDGSGQNLAGRVVHHLRPVLEVDEGAEAQDAHLPVVEAAKVDGGGRETLAWVKAFTTRGVVVVGVEVGRRTGAVWPWRLLTPGSSRRL